jgi:hypothetical protein
MPILPYKREIDIQEVIKALDEGERADNGIRTRDPELGKLVLYR